MNAGLTLKLNLFENKNKLKKNSYFSFNKKMNDLKKLKKEINSVECLTNIGQKTWINNKYFEENPNNLDSKVNMDNIFIHDINKVNINDQINFEKKKINQKIRLINNQPKLTGKFIYKHNNNLGRIKDNNLSIKYKQNIDEINSLIIKDTKKDFSVKEETHKNIQQENNFNPEDVFIFTSSNKISYNCNVTINKINPLFDKSYNIKSHIKKNSYNDLSKFIESQNNFTEILSNNYSIDKNNFNYYSNKKKQLIPINKISDFKNELSFRKKNLKNIFHFKEEKNFKNKSLIFQNLNDKIFIDENLNSNHDMNDLIMNNSNEIQEKIKNKNELNFDNLKKNSLENFKNILENCKKKDENSLNYYKIQNSSNNYLQNNFIKINHSRNKSIDLKKKKLKPINLNNETGIRKISCSLYYSPDKDYNTDINHLLQ